MKRQVSTLLLTLPLFSVVDAKEKPKDEKPNIIFLMTDDQAYYTIAAHGFKNVQTPNMDRLAHRGVSFMNHYATTSISMASRAIVMTGMYEYKTGCNFTHGAMSKDIFDKSYPMVLQREGYFTGFAGKFGFPVKDVEHDDKCYNYEDLPVESFDMWAGGVGQTLYPTAKNKYIQKYAEEYPHSSRAYGAFSCDFIDKAKESGKPFCLSVSFKAPHGPQIVDKKFDPVYRNTVFSRHSTDCEEQHDRMPKQTKLGRQYLYQYHVMNEDYQGFMRNYNQLIYGADYAIGMILDKLDKEGLRENTIIIFTSDNGQALGAHHFGMSKALPYEELSKIPLIIVDPRQEKNKGKRVESLTANIDIAPTILEYAGVQTLRNMDGQSLKVIAESTSKKEVRKHLPLMNVWGSPMCFSFSIVTNNLKYIYWGFNNKMEAVEELFDLEKDPTEIHNLANNPAYSKDKIRMQKLYDQQLDRWKKECTKRNNYEAFAKILQRNLPWAAKKDLIGEPFWKKYTDILTKNLNYDGDPHDYDKVIESRLK